MDTYSTFYQKTEIQSEYLGEPIYNMLDYTFEIPQNYSYNIFYVTEDYIARPDLISRLAYGDTMYTDIICKLNGISNPFELNEGMMLIIPTFDAVTDFMITPSLKDRDNNWGPSTSVASTNTAKVKTEKRQANESIIGDSRFKIDKSDGVIIY